MIKYQEKQLHTKKMTDKIDFGSFADPLMIIYNSLELINLQYDGVMDEKIINYLNHIKKSSRKIELLLRELKIKT